MHTHPKTWTHAITTILTQSPGEPQLRALASWLHGFAPTDHFVLFLYEGSHLPLPLFHTLPAELRATFIDDYRAGPYLLDPFCLGCLFDNADGLYGMRELAPGSFHSGHYFDAY